MILRDRRKTKDPTIEVEMQTEAGVLSVEIAENAGYVGVVVQIDDPHGMRWTGTIERDRAYAEHQGEPVTWALGMTSNNLPPVHLELDAFPPRKDPQRPF